MPYNTGRWRAKSRRTRPMSEEEAEWEIERKEAEMADPDPEGHIPDERAYERWLDEINYDR